MADETANSALVLAAVVQAVATVVLVGVTIWYAVQTHRLAELAGLPERSRRRVFIDILDQVQRALDSLPERPDPSMFAVVLPHADLVYELEEFAKTIDGVRLPDVRELVTTQVLLERLVSGALQDGGKDYTPAGFAQLSPRYEGARTRVRKALALVRSETARYVVSPTSSAC